MNVFCNIFCKLQFLNLILNKGESIFQMVICPSKSTIHPYYFPPQVDYLPLSSDKKEGKKESQESFQQNLDFILSSAPMWDRLELKNNKHLLGEFMKFKGKQDDIVLLRDIKRSKVSRMIIQKTSITFKASSFICTEGITEVKGLQNEVTVRSSTEVLFQLHDTNKIQKIKLSSIMLNFLFVASLIISVGIQVVMFSVLCLLSVNQLDQEFIDPNPVKVYVFLHRMVLLKLLILAIDFTSICCHSSLINLFLRGSLFEFKHMVK
ncbi:hypothetical protein LXL04_010601 [Taraxacum kok-saghyz]